MNSPERHSASGLLSRILGDAPPPFAVLHRPALGAYAEIMIGDVAPVAALAELPTGGPGSPPVLAVVPFRQLVERGFEVRDDGTPLLGLVVRERARLPLAELVTALPPDAGPFTETGYDVPDDDYRQIVSAVLDGEIAAGEGSNFVIHRSVTGQVAHAPARAALGALRQLLTHERDAYWAFAVHTPQVTLVGASPERHVSVDAGIVTMNPISGTLRYPAGGWSSAAGRQQAFATFLDDAKERDELWMVLDEELKMMAQVADRGGRVRGPYLKEMSALAHTEYLLEGETALDLREVLRATMFAPTVTGSPIRNACRVIARHERRGRGYYAGVLALLDHDEQGRPRLDAPILIRTARIDPDGRVAIPAGATLVRGSRPDAELAETRAKAAAILGAFTGRAGRVAPGPDHGPVEVADALARRNDTLARFWLERRDGRVDGSADGVAGGLVGGSVIVIDAEDDFTAMLAHVLRALGLSVEVVPWDRAGPEHLTAAHPVVLGPGPGDPADLGCERIAVLHRIAATRLAGGLPTLGICLGHQVLGLELGLTVRRLAVPDQGVQQVVPVFGRARTAAFYNSFVLAPPAQVPPGMTLDRDDASGRIVTMRRPGVAGLQFHPESVLTGEGIAILAEVLSRLIGEAATVGDLAQRIS